MGYRHERSWNFKRFLLFKGYSQIWQPFNPATTSVRSPQSPSPVISLPSLCAAPCTHFQGRYYTKSTWQVSHPWKGLNKPHSAIHSSEVLTFLKSGSSSQRAPRDRFSDRSLRLSVEAKDEGSHSEHKVSEGAQTGTKAAQETRHMAAWGWKRTAFSQRSMVYSSPTAAAAKSQSWWWLITVNRLLKVTSKEFQNILFKWEATVSAFFKNEQGIKSHWWENQSKPLS